MPANLGNRPNPLLAVRVLALFVQRLSDNSLILRLLGKPRRATTFSTAGARCCQAGHRPFPNDIAFKFGEGGEKVKGQFPVRRSRIDGIIQRFEPGAFVLDLSDQVDQIAERAAQAIQFPNNDEVAFPELIDHSAQFRPLGFGATDFFLVDHLAVFLPEGVEL